MARYVIDAPTLLRIVADGVEIDPGHQLVAPSAIRSQVMELLLDDVRRGVRTEKSALQLHDQMTEVKMRLLGDRVSRRTAWKIACEHDWDSLRDAEYLAVAKLQADALVTEDKDLAATAVGIVPVTSLESLRVAAVRSAET